jgi:hypothetical protein
MATITPSLTPLPSPGEVAGYNVAWGPMANGDVGATLDMLFNADRSIQVEGTFGAGGQVQLQGSNDGVNYRLVHDPQGNPLTVTAPAVTHMIEIPRLLRPAVTAGDGTTAITVTIFMKRTRQ